MNLWQELNSDQVAQSQKSLQRSEVDPALCWDLSQIFTDQAAWEEAFQELKASYPRLAEYAGKLGDSAATLKSYLEFSEKIGRELSQLYVYASHLSDQDKGNSENAALLARISALATEISAAEAYAQPELIALGREKIDGFVQELPELELYVHDFDKLFRRADHVLPAREEEILAAASELLEAGSKVFSVLNNADLKFPDVQDGKGEWKPLNHSTFGLYLQSQDRVLRENTFQTYYAVYEQFQNTLAMTLSRQIKRDNLLAKLRAFPSARAAAVFNNAIDEAVPQGLIDLVNRHLSLLHRFVALKKRLTGLSELHCYDLYLPYGESERRYTIDEAKEILFTALAPLGEGYVEILRTAFRERWIDFAVNQGKRSGAYSGGCYDSFPYILISWQGTRENLYTLAHELGHSCHSYLTRKTQPAVYGHYSIFLAEIASTTNENLLTQYLLAHESDPEEVKSIRFNWLERFKSTIFRQTQFAEFEHAIHLADQAGTALTSDYLNREYAELNQRYYGDELHADPEIRLEWSRIPHFYYNYYVYQYATGFAAAVSFAEMIAEEGESARDRYLSYLKAGCSDYPLPILKTAGIDMLKPEALERAMERFERELTAFEKMLDA